ncbi:hypothetical protein Tco_1374565, partial [Tanacetum coccineum]
MGHRLRGRVFFKFNVWVPIGKQSGLGETKEAKEPNLQISVDTLHNQIFRALSASADVPSSVTETTDTTSTLQPPPPPLQSY